MWSLTQARKLGTGFQTPISPGGQVVENLKNSYGKFYIIGRITFVNSIISVQENPAAPSERPPLGALLDTTPVPAAAKQQLVKQIEIKLVPKSLCIPLICSHSHEAKLHPN